MSYVNKRKRISLVNLQYPIKITTTVQQKNNKLRYLAHK